jgi:replicative DNA helicase
VEGNSQAKPTSIGDLIDSYRPVLDGPPEPRIPMPIPKLNEYLDGGLARGELMLLGAYAGTGKTTLTLQMATYAAQRSYHTLISSHEMMNRVILRRMLSQQSGVEARRIKRHSFTEDNRRSLADCFDHMHNLPMYLMDNASKIDEIWEVASALKQQDELDLVIVDYLQIVGGSGVQGNMERVDFVANKCKEIARLLNCAVIGISSVNRPPLDRLPRLSRRSLRDSGNLEHIPDLILLMQPRQIGDTTTEITVEKNRDGETGTFLVDWEPSFVRFSESGSIWGN